MADLLYIGIVVAFFALMVLFVRFCEHIVGPDPDLVSTSSPLASAEEVPA